jgi:hypothetical protein
VEGEVGEAKDDGVGSGEPEINVHRVSKSEEEQTSSASVILGAEQLGDSDKDGVRADGSQNVDEEDSDVLETKEEKPDKVDLGSKYSAVRL